MRMISGRFTKLIICLVGSSVMAIFTGCAAIEKHDDMQVERTLAAAGFEMRFADSPQQLKNIGGMTQRKLVAQLSEGRNVYIYADAEFCKCVYVGSEDAYQRFQQLAIQKEIANERMQTAEMNQDAAMDWGAWGPWGPRW